MQNNENNTGCTGRCENCSVNQRTYCASQMAYYSQQEIASLKEMLMSIINSKFEDSIIVLREEKSVTHDAGTSGETD